MFTEAISMKEKVISAALLVALSVLIIAIEYLKTM